MENRYPQSNQYPQGYPQSSQYPQGYPRSNPSPRNNQYPQKNKNSQYSGGNIVGIGLAGFIIGFVTKNIMEFFFSDNAKKKEEKAKNPISLDNSLLNEEKKDSLYSSKAEKSINKSARSIEYSEEELFCPITTEIMVEPVISKVCGHTFERASIVSWIEKNGTCPICKTQLSKADIIANYNLKNITAKLIAQEKKIKD